MKKNIEEYQSLVELLKQALKFYANPSNYIGAMGTIAPIDSDEHGSQARFALEKIEELEKINKNIENDYDRIVNNVLKSFENNQDNLDSQKIINSIKDLL